MHSIDHGRHGIHEWMGWSCVPNATDIPVIVRSTLSKALASVRQQAIAGVQSRACCRPE